jgi:hypothetical protein
MSSGNPETVFGLEDAMSVRANSRDNDDEQFEDYQEKVYELIAAIDRAIIPPSWWNTVTHYYFNHGYSEQRTAQTILDTRKT